MTPDFAEGQGQSLVSPLAQIVAEIEEAYGARDFAQTTSLLEHNLFAAWFGLQPQRFGEMLAVILRSDTELPPILHIMGTMLFAGTAGDVFESQPTDGDDFRVTSMVMIGKMFQLRLAGKMREAAELATEMESERGALRSIFDAHQGWTLFLSVQSGITAMLAGDFHAARARLAAARMHIVVPPLAFLSRDAGVKAAALEGLFGAPKQAKTLLEEADRIPRTESWVEREVDAIYTIASALTREHSPAEALRMLDAVPLQDLGESWPLYVETLQRLLLANGKVAESAQRMTMFEQLRLPFVEGDGHAGSVLPIAAALNAIMQGDLGEARSWLNRADGTIATARVLKAVFELAAGSPRDALKLASDLRDGTRGFRQLELWRLSVMAGSHLALGAEQECDAVIAYVLAAWDHLTPTEAGFFSPEVRAYAEERFPRWPKSEGALPAFRPFDLSREVLTDRELESLKLLASGQSREQIASRQFISINTLKGHLRSLYRKLGVSSRAAAVAEGELRGLI